VGERILVTGARGFLGTHLVAALGGAEIAAPAGDVREAATFEKLPRADVAFHLAAQSNVPESVRDPEPTWRVNVDGTLRLLEWARRTDAGRVVIVSSAHVFGRTADAPVDEDHPTRPASPYGASKVAAEALAQAYGASYGLPIVVVRPFNVYGPGQARGFLVPDIMMPLAKGEAPRLGDPRPVRDFTYVSDAVDLLVKAAHARDVAGEAFNLGSGEGVSVRELARLAVEVSGTGLEPTFDESLERSGDVRSLVVDNRKARELLDWAPRVALREGLALTWRSLTSPEP
jgi:UDP-glucose 4-epimerase